MERNASGRFRKGCGKWSGGIKMDDEGFLRISVNKVTRKKQGKEEGYGY